MTLRFNKSLNRLGFILLFLALICNSCRKLIDVDPPPTSTTGPTVYAKDATAIAVMTGLYTKMSSASFTAPGDILSFSLHGGLLSDEFIQWSGVTNAQQIAYYQNNLSAISNFGVETWNTFYPYIFTCNSVIEGVNGSVSLSSSVKQQLLGEAEFMRAFFYFYLVNLYGDVPMPLTSDYKVNAVISPVSKDLVYGQIIQDLLDAKDKLSANFLDATLTKTISDRLRPSKWAATALLARVYLYHGEWANAETQASLLINNSTQFGLSSLSNAFLKAGSGNDEAILQLQPISTTPTTNTQDAFYFITLPTGPDAGRSVYLSDSFMASFELDDQRKTSWISSVTSASTTYYFPYKYKNNGTGAVSEFEMLLRLGEQYLIRSEARAQLGESNAVDDLNNIRTRAGLPNYSGASDKTSLLAAILQERRIELFSELGHRWLDLKRTGNIDAVMGSGGACAAKGGTWNSYQQLFPLPIYDIQRNANLKQNSGY